ncbi:uncharacterized protein (DUF1015 family) [Motilibacter rhizosphaerae]|uniref:Uncharacterized protein (DUF1015 family) n=1 Tax=Motilibacter rhizosphaerae TaxID=598652 RepID=A0A4Q7NNL8_9ACTN|nr:DUF1015 family protein [Motilibacter rhizosphaerae]RZS86844.1 uncharacterized protein (DUF1015 family) [Motilibacter rhizosphaerae]
MVDFRPFAAWRPVPAAASRVLAPPYDVVDVAQARALAVDPDSFLHVSRPDIDCPPGADEGAWAHAALDGLVTRGVLREEPAAAYFAYRQTSGAHVQTGLVGLASVADYRSGAVATHELTRADKELDRVQHLEALSAHDEPVFLVSREFPELSLDEPPETSVVAPDGVLHEVWRVSDVPAVRDFFTGVPRIYVADGHHRSAAAARVHEALRLPGTSAFLAVVLPVEDVRVLAYDRVVSSAGGLEVADIAAAGFTVAAVPSPSRPASPHEFCLRLRGSWWSLRALDVPDDPVGALDVTLLQERLLGPLLGIVDPRTDPRISFVGGAEDLRLLEAAEGEVAVGLHPTSVEEMLRCADAGLVMPPKSTWFDPKLGSGLFVHRWG